MNGRLLNAGIQSEKDTGIEWNLSTRYNGEVEVNWAVRILDRVSLSVQEILSIYPHARFYKEHDPHVIW